MTDATIDAIFDQLDQDRHLAGYRLEERASPFFKMFLPEVMEKCGMAIRKPIIPECPYAKEKGTNRSPKVDFFAVSKNGCLVYLVELKTDLKSLDRGQINSLRSVLTSGVQNVLNGFREIAITTTDAQAKKKYAHIFQAIEQLRLGCGSELKPKIVYLLPRPPQERKDQHRLPRETRQDHLFYAVRKRTGPGTQGDLTALARRFACSLTRWAEHDAGSVLPGTPDPKSSADSLWLATDERRVIE